MIPSSECFWYFCKNATWVILCLPFAFGVVDQKSLSFPDISLGSFCKMGRWCLFTTVQKNWLFAFLSGFKTEEKLDLHMEKHLPGGVKKHACDVCGKRFPVNSKLKLHMRSHTGKTPVVHTRSALKAVTYGLKMGFWPSNLCVLKSFAELPLRWAVGAIGICYFCFFADSGVIWA